MTMRDPFKYSHSNHEINRLADTMYVRFRLSLRNVQDLLHEHGIDVSHETVRLSWHRFRPMFASEIRKATHRGHAVEPLAEKQGGEFAPPVPTT